MNIFFLHEEPDVCARFHFDRHVNKMRTELSQMLCVPFKNNNKDLSPLLPRLPPSHLIHPCTIWLCHSLENWSYGFDLLNSLNDEFVVRFGPKHTKNKVTHSLLHNFYKENYAEVSSWFPESEFTIPPQCFGHHPDLINPNASSLEEVIIAYREYYKTKKYDSSGQYQFYWTNRRPPEWLLEYL